MINTRNAICQMVNHGNRFISLQFMCITCAVHLEKSVQFYAIFKWLPACVKRRFYCIYAHDLLSEWRWITDQQCLYLLIAANIITDACYDQGISSKNRSKNRVHLIVLLVQIVLRIGLWAWAWLTCQMIEWLSKCVSYNQNNCWWYFRPSQNHDHIKHSLDCICNKEAIFTMTKLLIGHKT